MRLATLVITLCAPLCILSGQWNFDLAYGIPFPIDDLHGLRLPNDPGYALTAGLDYGVGENWGLGLQFNRSVYAYNRELIQRYDGLPGTSTTIGDDEWKASLLAISPFWRIGKPGFQFELRPKIGLALITPAQRKIDFSDGNQSLPLYEDLSTSENLNGLFYGLDAGLAVPLGRTLTLRLQAGLNTNGGLGNGTSTIYRDGTEWGANPDLEAVAGAPLYRKDCKAYTLVTTGVGLRLTFGEKERPTAPTETMIPPVPTYPENGAGLTEAEARDLTLRWDAETPDVKAADYQLTLYARTESGDSLVFSGEAKNRELSLPDGVRLAVGRTYQWRVQAIGSKALAPCPDGCRSVYATFSVGGAEVPNFYQLLDKSRGLAVPAGSLLRFIIDDKLCYEAELSLHLRDVSNQPVLENVSLREKDDRITTVGKNRFILALDRLTPGREYELEITNGKRSQYLRFYRTGAKSERDEE